MGTGWVMAKEGTADDDHPLATKAKRKRAEVDNRLGHLLIAVGNIAQLGIAVQSLNKQSMNRLISPGDKDKYFFFLLAKIDLIFISDTQRYKFFHLVPKTRRTRLHT